MTNNLEGLVLIEEITLTEVRLDWNGLGWIGFNWIDEWKDG